MDDESEDMDDVLIVRTENVDTVHLNHPPPTPEKNISKRRRQAWLWARIVYLWVSKRWIVRAQLWVVREKIVELVQWMTRPKFSGWTA